MPIGPKGDANKPNEESTDKDKKPKEQEGGAAVGDEDASAKDEDGKARTHDEGEDDIDDNVVDIDGLLTKSE